MHKPALPSRIDFLRLAVSLLARRRDPPSILEIGCGPGNIFGKNAVNVDNVSLEAMKAQAKPLHGDIEIPNFVQADAEDLPFGDKTFDVAVLSEVLEHVNNPVAAIREARRVGHFVIITVPNEYLWSPDKNPFTPEERSGHKRQFTSETIIKTAREAGLEILEYMDWQYVGWAYFIIIGR